MSGRPGATVHTVAPGLSFVDVLAEGLLKQAAGEPMALARQVILLPTRRACRALREAFLRHGGGRPLLLPRLRPLGELDEDELTLLDEAAQGDDLELPPAVPPLKRQLLLARLIMGMGGSRGGQPPSPGQAAQLAAELGRLLDQVQTEGLDFTRLKELVPADYAAHWQITLDFLALLTEHWPKILAEQGLMDAAERRRRLILAQAAQWRAEPPDFPVIAAGSTGSMPATAELLAVVAGLPHGRLVLPGLDRDMDDAAWAAVDASHPQFGMKALLERLELDRRDVRLWHRAASPRPERARLIAEAMRPAATTDAWRDAEGIGPKALDGVTLLACPGPREEAGAIALMLRQALEEPERVAALVTPDRALARRVAAEMRRWGIEVDDSGGRPLHLTPPGMFLRLVLDMAAEGCAPHPTLAALKHPLACGGMAAPAFRRNVRRLELAVLRGPRPAPGFAGMRAAGQAGKGWDEALDKWLAGLEWMARPFAELLEQDAVPLAELLRAHVALAEALAADERQSGAERLWAGDAGEAAARFVSDLADAAAAMPAMRGADYAGLFETLLAGGVVRPRWGGHPRVHVLGQLEARLQHADLVVLGGLNEGTWPPQVTADPWMSRPMRAAFGLPLPERKIGLAAHDFAQAFCAPQVVITRAARVDGTPTVPSRWLLRLETVLRACGLDMPAPPPWVEWFLRLDKPERLEPGAPPAPCPPVGDRPRELSATQIETWMRDPYAIYARHVLGLKALDPIDADPGAADLGSVVHGALEDFLTAWPDELPPDALDRLLEMGRARFAPLMALPGVHAFWWPRFERIAAWFAGVEAERRHLVARSVCEAKGTLTIEGPAGPFTLTARADRIDVQQDGSLVLIDYKTGAPPTAKEVAAGYAPQLPIEAAIALAGGFPSIPGKEVSALEYWRLKGGETGGEIRSAGGDPATLAAEALEGVRKLVEVFDFESTPYRARPHPDHAPRFSDYLHLARVKEWASLGEDGE
jgi:ATP-dependent helicase/nuclease subunit B